MLKVGKHGEQADAEKELVEAEREWEEDRGSWRLRRVEGEK